MAGVNRVLTALFDVLLSPLGRLSPLAGLIVLALVTAVLVLLAFKWTADQRALVATKRSIQAGVLEMRLFNDDLAALLRAQGEVLRHTVSYVRLSLTPTLWVIVPIAALMLHMEFHFGYTGLTAGQAVLVTVEFEPAPETPGMSAAAAARSKGSLAATLEAPDAVRVETPAVLLPSAREVVWRVRPRDAGSYELRVRMGDEVLGKTLLVSDAIARRSPVRPGADLLSQLLHPSEPPLAADSGVSAITLHYPERGWRVAGWDLGWSVVYLAFTLVFALALKGLFGVTM